MSVVEKILYKCVYRAPLVQTNFEVNYLSDILFKN